MRIAIGAAKGGVGKTTTAVYLALNLAKSGPTLLVDGDPQRSATAWWRAAEHAGWSWPVTLSLGQWPARGGLRLPDDRSIAHVVVDTGPGDQSRMVEAMRACEVAIVPSGARGADLGQVGITAEGVAKAAADHPGLTWGVLLTQVRLGTKSGVRAREALDAEDVPRWDVVIPQREVIAVTYGTVPPTGGPYADLLDEITTAAEADQ